MEGERKVGKRGNGRSGLKKGRVRLKEYGRKIFKERERTRQIEGRRSGRLRKEVLFT